MDIITNALSGINVSALGSYSGLLIALVVLLVIVLFFKLSFKLIWNAILGAVVLWLVNFVGAFVGFALQINIWKALIVGFFGVPGAVAVVLFEIFGK